MLMKLTAAPVSGCCAHWRCALDRTGPQANLPANRRWPNPARRWHFSSTRHGVADPIHATKAGLPLQGAETLSIMTRSTSPCLTDLYELNMVQAYLDRGEDGEAVFEFFVRRLPARRGFLLAAGSP